MHQKSPIRWDPWNFSSSGLHSFRGAVLGTHPDFSLVRSHRSVVCLALDGGGDNPVYLQLPMGIKGAEQISNKVLPGSTLSGVVHVGPNGMLNLRAGACCYTNFMPLVRVDDGPALPTLQTIWRIEAAELAGTTDQEAVWLLAKVSNVRGRKFEAVLKWHSPHDDKPHDSVTLDSALHAEGLYVVVVPGGYQDIPGHAHVREAFVCSGPYAADRAQFPAVAGDLAQAIFGMPPQVNIDDPTRPGLMRRALNWVTHRTPANDRK